MSELTLPEGWIKTEISNVADVIAGGTPSSKNPDYFSEPGTDIPWLTPADLTGYEKMYISHGRRDITEDGYKSSSAKLMPKGSVVFSSRAPIGYVAIAEKELSTNQGFKSFVVPEELSSEYLYFYLKSIKGLAESLGTGTTFKELSGRACKKLPLIMAPLAEQKVIAHTLEYNLKTVSQIQARLDAIPKLIEKFRQSILNDAVTGRLTEDWRIVNKLEFDWKDIKLGDVSRVNTGKTPLRKDSRYWESGTIPWLTSSVTGQSYCYEAKEFVTKVAVKENNLKLFPKGSLLIAMYGEGKTRGQVTELMLEATCNQACAVIEVNERFALSSFIKLKLIENYVETRKAASGGNQPNLNLSKVRAIRLDLPSIKEQEQIVEQVKQLFAHANQIEKSVATAKARVDNLTQSILHQAFTGNLTAEWRDQNPELISGDNSAEALLAKIKAEKKKTSKA